MVIACWSVKGGSGTTVVAAALAARLSRGGPVTLVDLAGDQPAVLGLSPPTGPGIIRWLRDWPAGDELRRSTTPVAPQLDLLPWEGAAPGDERERAGAGGGAMVLDVLAGLGGGAALHGDRSIGGAEASAALGEALSRWPGTVVVDAGTVGPAGPRGPGGPGGPLRPALAGEPAALGGGHPGAWPGTPVEAVVQAAAVSLLVTRPCFLSLHRALHLPFRATGVVIVDEPTRSMGRHDVEQVLGLPVVAHVPWDARVSRAIDGGTLVRRPPRSLERALADVPVEAGEVAA